MDMTPPSPELLPGEAAGQALPGAARGTCCTWWEGWAWQQPPRAQEDGQGLGCSRARPARTVLSDFPCCCALVSPGNYGAPPLPLRWFSTFAFGESPGGPVSSLSVEHFSTSNKRPKT